MTVYEKIEMVLDKAGKPLAAHEFTAVVMQHGEFADVTGRMFVGCSEATLARRLREMRQQARVSGQRREGKTFVEYSRRVAVAA